MELLIQGTGRSLTFLGLSSSIVDFQPQFWGEAMCAAYQIRNRLPSKSSPDKHLAPSIVVPECTKLQNLPPIWLRRLSAKSTQSPKEPRSHPVAFAVVSWDISLSHGCSGGLEHDTI